MALIRFWVGACRTWSQQITKSQWMTYFRLRKYVLGVQFVCWSFASKGKNDIKYNKWEKRKEKKREIDRNCFYPRFLSIESGPLATAVKVAQLNPVVIQQERLCIVGTYVLTFPLCRVQLKANRRLAFWSILLNPLRIAGCVQYYRIVIRVANWKII